MAVQAFGPLLAGLLWSTPLKAQFPHWWPLGYFFSWNVFALVCCAGFVGSLWIMRRDASNTDTAL